MLGCFSPTILPPTPPRMQSDPGDAITVIPDTPPIQIEKPPMVLCKQHQLINGWIHCRWVIIEASTPGAIVWFNLTNIYRVSKPIKRRKASEGEA